MASIIQPDPAPSRVNGLLKKSKVTTCVVIATTEGLTLATTSAIEGSTNVSPLEDGGDHPESAGVVLADGGGLGDGDGGAACGGEVSISGNIVQPVPNIRERTRTNSLSGE